MLKTINHLTFGIRRSSVPWLKKHTTTQKITSSIYDAYTTLTGSFHLLPDFIIIGGKKCGTSSLYFNLVKHPQIEPCLTKEIDYFNRYFHKGVKWYRSSFPYAFYKKFAEKILSRKLITGEGSPTYIYHPLAPKRVKEIVPNAKIIAILRNPVERAYSHYRMEVNHGNEKLAFEEAIAKEEKRIAGEFEKMKNDETYYSMKYQIYSYSSSGIYVDQIKRWLDLLSPEQLLILQSEEFQKNKQETFDRVFKFLNLPPWKISRYKDWQVNIYNRQINPSTRKELVEFFRPHNERLYKLLGTDFEWN